MLSNLGPKAPSGVARGCSSSSYHRRLLNSPQSNHTMPHSPNLHSHVCGATGISHQSADLSFYATRPSSSCFVRSTSSISQHGQRPCRDPHRHHRRVPYIPHASARDASSYGGSETSATEDDIVATDDVGRIEEPSTALLLAWFACGNRSLFAAQCLVEVVVELYREGRSFEELQLSLKVAAQSRIGLTAAADGQEVPEVPLLQGQAEDVLISWLALVFLTLEELGVPRDKQQQPATPPLPSTSPQLSVSIGEALGADSAAALRLGAFGSAVGGGVSERGGGSGGMAASSAYLRGMLGYVRQTLGMYDEGQTLPRVAGLQGLVQQASSAASSPFLLLMQQYTRLVLLTVEVVAAAHLPTRRPLQPPGTVTGPSGYTAAFIGSCSAADLEREGKQGQEQQQGGAGEGEGGGEGGDMGCPPRGLAVRLLLAFMGAVLGSDWSREKFVEGVRVAYEQGLAADELFAQLDEREFLQSGGLLPIADPSAAATSSATTPPRDPSATPKSQQEGAEPSQQQQEGAEAGGAAGGSAASVAGSSMAAPAPAPQHVITKALLSTWISLSYMALAQLGVPYPSAGQRLGWAWAGFGDPIEAIGMNDFVGNALRQMAGADPRAMPPPPPPSPTPDTEPGTGSGSISAAASSEASNAGFLAAASDAGAACDPAAEEVVGTQRRRRGEGVLMVRMEDEQLPVTSTAFRVLSQQVALVQAVCRQVVDES